MPDVFQVLKLDHDEVKAMLAKLESGPKAAPGVGGDHLADRKRIVDQLIIEQSKHEAAEQQYFWPAVRQVGAAGQRVADEALSQEAEAEEVLAELDKASPGDARFEELVTDFTASARAHIAFEEAHAWPLLAALITPEEADALGERINQAKKLAPTRPHPSTPASQGAAKTAGPVAGVADRLRDMVTGRGRAGS